MPARGRAVTVFAAGSMEARFDDGAAGAANYYRFTLSEAKQICLGLRRQDADADLIREDADSNVLHSSAKRGTANEWLRETLRVGRYYVPGRDVAEQR